MVVTCTLNPSRIKILHTAPLRLKGMNSVYRTVTSPDDVSSACHPQLKELYTLLNENYVEDDDNMFRFDYSPDFLLW